MSHTHSPRLAQPSRSPQGDQGEPGRQGLPNAPQFLSPLPLPPPVQAHRPTISLPPFPCLPLCKPTAAGGACPSQQGPSKTPRGRWPDLWAVLQLQVPEQNPMGLPASQCPWSSLWPQRPDLLGPLGSGTGSTGWGLCAGGGGGVRRGESPAWLGGLGCEASGPGTSRHCQPPFGLRMAGGWGA